MDNKIPKAHVSRKDCIKDTEIDPNVCQINDAEILSGHIGKDHINILISKPPHISAHKLVQYGKVSSWRKLQIIIKSLKGILRATFVNKKYIF